MYNDKEKVKKSNKKKGRRFFFLPLKDSERVLSNTEKKYFRILNSELIVNALLIVLGIILCFINFDVKIYLGILFILYGLIKMWAFKKREDISLFKISIIYGCISIILGIVTMFVSTNIMLGLWFILTVIENLELGFRLKKVEEKSWNFVLMSCVLVLFIGILLMVNPFNNLSIYQVTGIFLILYGVLSSSKLYMLEGRSYNFI